MNPSQRPRSGQQARVSHHARNADSFAFFNLLTGPQLLDRIEAGLPVHRERKFPPTETLSMFLAQVLSADGSCQQALDDVLVSGCPEPRRNGGLGGWRTGIRVGCWALGWERPGRTN
jgi:hypothetical protein